MSNYESLLAQIGKTIDDEFNFLKSNIAQLEIDLNHEKEKTTKFAEALSQAVINLIDNH